MSPETQRRIDRIASAPLPWSARHKTAAFRREEHELQPVSDPLTGRTPVVNEALFKGSLIREHKRMHRSERSFALLLVSVDDRIGSKALLIWESVSEALAMAKRDTDVLGWFKQGTVMGVILTEIASRDAALVSGIEARVKRELAKRLSAKTVSSLTVQLHADEHLLRQVLPSPVRKVSAYAALKRTLDVAGSLALLAVLSPVFLVIAALVKFGSKGPVFFRQERIGEHAKPFRMLKFRTMFTGTDHAIHHEFVTRFIKGSNQCNEPVKDAPFKIAHDPRITPVGRFLRRSSLDELPQFLNVLRGEMSLVGPRPPLPYEVAVYQSWHRRRVLEAKPGITGLWQVVGRSRTTFDEMVRLDLQYARARSLRTDIKILLATPAAVVTGKGAC